MESQKQYAHTKLYLQVHEKCIMVDMQYSAKSCDHPFKYLAYTQGALGPRLMQLPFALCGVYKKPCVMYASSALLRSEYHSFPKSWSLNCIPTARMNI